MKPKFKPQVHYAATKEGVYLRTWTNEVEIKGKNLYAWIEQIIPYLNGEKTVEELTGNLPEPQKGFVNSLIQELVNRGIVVDASEDCLTEIGEEEGRLYRQTLLFLEDASAQGRKVFRSFRERRMLLLGDGLGHKALVRALIKMGLQAPVIERTAESSLAEFVTEWSGKDRLLQAAWIDQGAEGAWLAEADVLPELVVLASDAYDDARAQQLMAACRARGVDLLIASTLGGTGVVGPVMDREAAASWTCLLDRYTGGAADEAAAASPIFKMLVGNTAALEAFKHLTELHDVGVRDQVVLIDPVNLQSTLHKLEAAPKLDGLGTPEEALGHFRAKTDEQPQEEFLYAMEAYKDAQIGLLHTLHPGDLWQIPMALTQAVMQIPHSLGGQQVSVIVGGEKINDATEKAVREGFLAYARVIDEQMGAAKPAADLWSWSHGRTYGEWVGRGVLNALAEHAKREGTGFKSYKAADVILPKELPYLKMLSVRYGLDLELAVASLGAGNGTLVQVLADGQVLAEAASRTPFEAMRDALVDAMTRAQLQVNHPEMTAAALEMPERKTADAGGELAVASEEGAAWADWSERALHDLQQQGIGVVLAPWGADKAVFEAGVLIGQVGLNVKEGERR